MTKIISPFSFLYGIMGPMRKLEVGVKAIISDGRGKYLFIKRAKPYYQEQEEHWDIPGGRIKAGEPHLEGLEREIKEETGLTIKGIDEILLVQDILRHPDYHTVRITFLLQANGEVRLSEEHSDYQWLTTGEIKKLPHDRFLDEVFDLI